MNWAFYSAAIIVFAGVMFLAGCQSTRPPSVLAAPELKVSIAYSDQYSGPQDDAKFPHLWWQYRIPYLDVVIENVSPHPINIFDSWNAWGLRDTKIEWDADGKRGVIYVEDHGFSMNYPSVTTLPPGGVVVRRLYDGKSTESWPRVYGVQKLTLRAVFEEKQVMSSDADEKFPRVWEGRVTSIPIVLRPAE